jgi:hypothetical protein
MTKITLSSALGAALIVAGAACGSSSKNTTGANPTLGGSPGSGGSAGSSGNPALGYRRQARLLVALGPSQWLRCAGDRSSVPSR